MKKQEADNRRKGHAHSKTVELHRGQLTGRALLITASASTLDLPSLARSDSETPPPGLLT